MPKYSTRTEFVDGDTGELLTKHQAQTNYIIIKKHKHVKKAETPGGEFITITFTYICQENKQGKLFE